MKNILRKIKEAWKKMETERKMQERHIEQAEERIRFEFCGYDEEDIHMPEHRPARPVKACVALLLALSLVLSNIPNICPDANPYVAEAKTNKKDKKKPVIKFSGKSKITVEKNKSVKIPKTTAKDNKDGNVTKKLKVTVKKGKKNFSNIAKAVKNNKKTKFTSTGTYKITYTVKDKAGNKATKTRTINVVDSKNTNKTTQTPTTEKVTTEAKTTEKVTTQTPTTEKVTTEQPTTEQPTTEQPTTEQPTFVFNDLPEPVVGDENWKFHSIKLNGKKYYVVNDPDWKTNLDNFSSSTDDFSIENNPKLDFNIKNDYEYLMLSKDSGLINNAEYLKYLGEITAQNRYGEELSTAFNMTIYSPFNKNNVVDGPNNVAYIYINGNQDQVMIPIYLNIVTFDKNKNYDENSFKSQGYELLSKDPLVYGKKRVYAH
ncbi:MAG: DUF5011 domain-containing protein [Clostridium sp.]|nr:DUF5011 domain-containing protein [Clostridium sp.]